VDSLFYTVDQTNTAVIENGVFHFKFWSSGPLMPGKGYTVYAWVSLTDALPAATPAGTDMPYFTASETPTLTVVDFSDCVTNILFPYVTTYTAGGTAAFSNFGTGLNISNTTVDPFTVGGAVAQSGTCTFTFYPATGSAVTYTTGTITAGSSVGFDAAATAKFKNSSGYAIAVCNFQNAYGYAFIYDNYGIGAPGVAQGYVAYVLPNPAFYHRSPAGDGLGETAIAPVNLNKFWEKLLLTGSYVVE